MTRTRRWTGAFRDAGTLLAVVWSVPLAILLVGAPIALVVALGLWIGRMVLRAF